MKQIIFTAFTCLALIGCGSNNDLGDLSDVELYEIDLAGIGITNQQQVTEMTDEFIRASEDKRKKLWSDVRAKRALRSAPTVKIKK